MYRHLLLSFLLCCAGTGCSRTQSTASSAVTAESAAAPVSVIAAPVTPAPSAEPSSVAPSADQKGLRAFIDPVTGETRAPTQAELAAEAIQRNVKAAAVKSRAAVEEIHLPNGMTEVRLGKDAEVAEITCIQKDGSFGPCPPEKAAELRAKDKKNTP